MDHTRALTLEEFLTLLANSHDGTRQRGDSFSSGERDSDDNDDAASTTSKSIGSLTDTEKAMYMRFAKLVICLASVARVFEPKTKSKWSVFARNATPNDTCDNMDSVLECYILVQHLAIEYARSNENPRDLDDNNARTYNLSLPSSIHDRRKPGQAAHMAIMMAVGDEFNNMSRTFFSSVHTGLEQCQCFRVAPFIQKLAVLRYEQATIADMQTKSLDQLKQFNVFEKLQLNLRAVSANQPIALHYLSILERKIVGTSSQYDYMCTITSPEAIFTTSEHLDLAVKELDRIEKAPMDTIELELLTAKLKNLSKFDLDSPKRFDEIYDFVNWIARQHNNKVGEIVATIPQPAALWAAARLVTLKAVSTMEELCQDRRSNVFSWQINGILYMTNQPLRKFFKMVHLAWILTAKRITLDTFK